MGNYFAGILLDLGDLCVLYFNHLFQPSDFCFQRLDSLFLAFIRFLRAVQLFREPLRRQFAVLSPLVSRFQLHAEPSGFILLLVQSTLQSVLDLLKLLLSFVVGPAS